MILPSKGAFEPCMTWEEKCKTSNTNINRMIIYQDRMTKFKLSTKTKFPKTLNRQKSSLKLHKLTQIIPPKKRPPKPTYSPRSWRNIYDAMYSILGRFFPRPDKPENDFQNHTEKNIGMPFSEVDFFVSFYPKIDHLNCLSSCDEEPDRFTKPAKHFQRLNWVTTSHGAVKMFVSHLVKVLLWWLWWNLWFSS